MLITQLDLVQKRAKRNKDEFMEEFHILKSRIARLEVKCDLALANVPTEPTKEHLIATTQPWEPQRQLEFWLPPPRIDPYKITKEYDIPRSLQ